MKLNEVQLNTLLDIASKSDRKVLLLDECGKNVPKRSKLGIRCAHGTSKAHDIKSVYAQSQFCLIAKTERLFELNFIEALAANCIPVIFADNVILPFSEVSKWEWFFFCQNSIANWQCFVTKRKICNTVFCNKDIKNQIIFLKI